MTVVALSIAGSDSGGGAGIQADLKTFEAHGVFGATAITAITAQNTSGVEGIWPVPVEMIVAQINAVLSDMPVKAIKTGMLFSSEIIRAVGKIISGHSIPVVVDPVMIATSGDSLIQSDSLTYFKNNLLPFAAVTTPNIPEAEALSGMKIHSESDMESAAEIMGREFPSLSVLIKGGHLGPGEFKNPESMNDLLYASGKMTWIEGRRMDTKSTHGTGCTLSSAIAANIAMGFSVMDSVKRAKKYLEKALAVAWQNNGKGRGSLRHNLQMVPVQ